jgi:uncharacterized membrane protein YjgN (DUF898 family)
MGKMVLGFIPFGLLVPWAMTSLWNDRWNKMSFGRNAFVARAETGGLIGRWLLIYLVPVIGGAIIAAGMGSAFLAAAEGGTGTGGAVTMVLGVLFIYVGFLLASLSFYAAYYRQVIGATSIAGVEFRFTARTKDWLLLILGNIALVLFTLGIGALFLSYRNWSFGVRHMEASGNVDLAALLQSTTAATGDAEGLADAFDIGAV